MSTNEIARNLVAQTPLELSQQRYFTISCFKTYTKNY